MFDDALYSENKSLRLPYTPKYDNVNRCMKLDKHIVKKGTLKEMFVTDIVPVYLRLAPSIGLSSKPHRYLYAEDSELNPECM